MRTRQVEVVLVLLFVASVVGCGDDTIVQAPAFSATGRWGGVLSDGTQTLGTLMVNVDAQGKIVDGMLSGPTTSVVIREGSINRSGLMKLEFGDGTRLQTTYLTIGNDGTKLTGSGTLTAPDGTQTTVSFTLNRLP